MLYKETEWGGENYFYCGCVDNLGEHYLKWLVPCRILNITPAEYVKMLVEEFNATIFYSQKNTFVSRKWKNQADMRKWKNFINKKAREINFQI